MKGWIVSNDSLNSPKFTQMADEFVKAADGLGVRLERVGNSEVSVAVAGGGALPDFVLFWDKDVRQACLLESAGVRLFNSAAAIALCDDKALTYARLYASGIKMPKTLISPLIFREFEWEGSAFLKGAEEILGYPMIVKECFGSYGDQVYLENDRESLLGRLASLGNRPFVLQEFISESRGRDIRIQVVGGKAVAAMYRYSDNGDFRANLSNGGKMLPYETTEAQRDMAVTACRALGLDFAGVDILFGEKGEPVLCEVNSNAHFKNLRECTGVNTAGLIIEHIVAAMGKEG